MHKQVDTALDAQTLQRLISAHPWLEKYSGDIEKYIPPDYYDSLLKEYTSGGKSELEIFSSFLQMHKNDSFANVLELGCGSGRATDAFLGEIKNFSHFDLVDLSPEMTEHTAKLYQNDKRMNVHVSDNINYLANCKKRYEFIFSLWSLSHSIHQHMVDEGMNAASAYIRKSIKSFIENCLAPKSKWYVIHFDSQSEEQRILMQQWQKNFPIFRQGQKQSPSKQLLDQLFFELDKKMITNLNIEHFEGDPIWYANLEELLETFFNFHMETEYNRSKDLESLLDEVTKSAAPYRQDDGSYSVKTGFFIYSFQKK